MTLFLTLIGISLSTSVLLMLIKPELPKVENIVSKISWYSFIGVVLCSVLLFFDLRLKGRYTASIIGLTFITSTILLFGLTQKPLRTLLTGIIAVPNFIFGILSIFLEGPLVFFYLMAIPFEYPMAKFEIDSSHNVEVRVGGPFACGESLTLTRSTLGVLDKQYYLGNSLCVTGIDQIETKLINENEVEFLIYHDGKREFESPYRYRTEIKKEIKNDGPP